MEMEKLFLLMVICMKVRFEMDCQMEQEDSPTVTETYMRDNF